MLSLEVPTRAFATARIRSISTIVIISIASSNSPRPSQQSRKSAHRLEPCRRDLIVFSLSESPLHLRECFPSEPLELAAVRVSSRSSFVSWSCCFVSPIARVSAGSQSSYYVYYIVRRILPQRRKPAALPFEGRRVLSEFFNHCDGHFKSCHILLERFCNSVFQIP